jgi:hypothetical protein
MQIDQNQAYLKILSKTWGRDSHGLFDYESNQIKTNVLLPNSNCKVVRKRNDVRQLQENVELDMEERELAKVHTDQSKFN